MTHSRLADKIEQWPTAKLVPYARNARTHSDAQVAQIAASIVEFGFTNPILAGSDGVIVDVICRRWAEYTGRTPVHAVSGAAFPVEEREPE